MGKNLIFFLVIAISNVATYTYRDDLESLFKPKIETIIAEITLERNCDMMPSAFIIRDLDTGKFVSFNTSTVYLSTSVGNVLQIATNPRFSEVTSNFDRHEAQRKMIIKIDCATSNRLQNILDSLKNTFKN